MTAQQLHQLLGGCLHCRFCHGQIPRATSRLSAWTHGDAVAETRIDHPLHELDQTRLALQLARGSHMPHRSHEISILNGLIETTQDSCHGYSKAAAQAKNLLMAKLFRHRADQRRQVTAELRAVVLELGGSPPEAGTALASAYRAFPGLRAHMGSTHKAVLQEVERREDHIRQKFERALRDRHIGMITRLALQSASLSVNAGHDAMRELKQSHDQRRPLIQRQRDREPVRPDVTALTVRPARHGSSSAGGW